ncbi:MAG TPA: hypothetical protein VE111_04335 [Bradyrhizobium sp.]|nr:hypothetical protein [Bradyrhizobium sp.]
MVVVSLGAAAGFTQAQGSAGPSAEAITIKPDAKTGKPELAVSRTEFLSVLSIAVAVAHA